jgi:hypothetical protein
MHGSLASTWPKIPVHINLTSPHPGAEVQNITDRDHEVLIWGIGLHNYAGIK